MEASKPGRIISCRTCLVALTGEASVKYNTQFYFHRIYDVVSGWGSETAPSAVVFPDAAADLSDYLKENVDEIDNNMRCRNELARKPAVNGDFICCIKKKSLFFVFFYLTFLFLYFLFLYLRAYKKYISKICMMLKFF